MNKYGDYRVIDKNNTNNWGKLLSVKGTSKKYESKDAIIDNFGWKSISKSKTNQGKICRGGWNVRYEIHIW